MTSLHAALVTPLSGALVPFGQASATGLALWARYAASLPPPWTDVELDVRDSGGNTSAAMRAALDAQPDVLFGPYGSSTMLAAARASDRAVWNHGGATSQLARPAFPRVINVLSPASTYLTGVLQAVRAFDPWTTTVSLFHATSGFGRDVATGAAAAASTLHFEVQTVPFEPYHAALTASTVPHADMLLVVGNFADELAVAPILLTRPWRAAAFVGAGVEEVLAPLGMGREGLLGPAQWIATLPLEPDEGPDTDWFVTKYRDVDAAQLAAARQLSCTTLYGTFRLDPLSGLQSGHQILIVQWQHVMRRVVWPPERAERPLRLPLRQ